jgi:hypothetical protein
VSLKVAKCSSWISQQILTLGGSVIWRLCQHFFLRLEIFEWKSQNQKFHSFTKNPTTSQMTIFKFNYPARKWAAIRILTIDNRDTELRYWRSSLRIRFPQWGSAGVYTISERLAPQNFRPSNRLDRPIESSYFTTIRQSPRRSESRRFPPRFMSTITKRPHRPPHRCTF